MAIKQAHVWIAGRVQGVLFRHHTQEEAIRRRLKGWVRNLYDGRVEAVFQGEEGDLGGMVQWCHRGPPAAWVQDVELVWEEPDPNMTGFRVQYSA
jgi:acylphosphatase